MVARQSLLEVGVRLRHSDIESISPGNFGGTYTFGGGFGPGLDENDQILAGPNVEISSLERYRRTLVFSRAGIEPGRDSRARRRRDPVFNRRRQSYRGVKQTDVALYLQDEWKIRPNFTLSPGFRYENQTNIHSNFNFAPRIAFAWSPVFGGAKKTVATETRRATGPTTAAAGTTPAATVAAAPPAPAAAPAGPPKTVIRGGIGIFYNRISEDYTLQASRFNGTNQQQFLTTDPAVLDLFPLVPSITTLDEFSQPQVRRAVSDDINSFRSLRRDVHR